MVWTDCNSSFPMEGEGRRVRDERMKFTLVKREYRREFLV